MLILCNQDKIISECCKSDFFDFVQEFWDVVIQDEPVFNWHIPFLCKELQTIAERVFRNEPKAYDFICNIPPGTTKSTIASVMFTPWLWTRMPRARTINASYAYDLAVDLSRKSRDIVLNERYQRYFPHVRLRTDENAKSQFTNVRGGTRYCVGTGGAITGKHAHFIIVDDPLNPKQAASTPELKAANDFMRETLSSRKVNKEVTPTILIMQRLHQNDPTGSALDREKKEKEAAEKNGEDISTLKKIRHVCLPGELTEDVSPKHLRRRYRDGLLDTQRLPRKVLKEMESELGPYGYAGQVKQRPVPRGGGMFKIDMLEFAPPVDNLAKHFVRLTRFWDKAGTEGGGAYSVGVLMGLHKVTGKYWVLDVKRFQKESGGRERTIRNTAELDGKRTIVGVEREPGSGGLESAQATAKNLAGFRVRIILPSGDKAERADPFSVQVNIGNVVVVNTHWTKAYVDEMEFFPFSTYKDQMDASSGCFNLMTRPIPHVGAL